jgi:hypothetical protein
VVQRAAPERGQSIRELDRRKEGLTLYGELENAQPVRKHIDPKWLPPEQVLQDGVTYFDTYEPDYVLTQRQEARDFFASILNR